jgi:putative redox protein
MSAQMNASMTWTQGMQFKCDNRGMNSVMDAMPDFGGVNAGPTPKELVLNAMMGCTAMDVVSMLKKMRQEITAFQMRIDVTKNSEHPVHFKAATLYFDLSGEVDKEKVMKSVTASLTKYCGVNYMISKTCQIQYEVRLNQEKIGSGQATFQDPVS